MHTITVRNVNEAFPVMLELFRQGGDLIETEPRGTRRLELNAPLATTYLMPRERVLFDPHRDCNPFFHLMESLWILNGNHDVMWLAQFLPAIAGYSDDGDTFHGAYGRRMRHPVDQVQSVINRLRADPDSTRAVIALYHVHEDALYDGKDMPCNCTLMFSIRRKMLELTVCNRSNDLIWGAYGANVVQFSMIQEYIAHRLGVEVGRYVQFSNNAHIYPDADVTKRCLSRCGYLSAMNAYTYEGAGRAGLTYDAVRPFPLISTSSHQWDEDLVRFINGYGDGVFVDPFFEHVAKPMAWAYGFYKANDLKAATVAAGSIHADDWRLACQMWLQRRIDKREEQERNAA